MSSKTDRQGAVVTAVVGTAVVAGVAVRSVLTRTPFWLDEAQTAAIVELDLPDMFEALREDGHPPAYYVLLKGWSELFGDSDAALRSLSVVLSLVGLALIGHLARRRLGIDGGIVALALTATSPFVVRYATEARMYALVVVLAACAWLCWEAVFDPAGRPGRRGFWLAGFALSVGGLLLTHYWAVFPLAVAAALLVWWSVRGEAPRRHRARGMLVAGAVGALAFAPWLPSFLHQMTHTGTPWAASPNPGSALVIGLSDFAGGRHRNPALMLTILFSGLLALGVAGRGTARDRISLELRGVPGTRSVAGFVLAAVALALAVISVTDSAFASRYLAIIVPPVMVVAARGVQQFVDDLVRAGVLATVCLLGMMGSWVAVDEDRSQGEDLAEVMAPDLGPDDVVVACPDQLGPATHRYLPGGTDVLAYPTLESAERVDWTDYAERNEAADPEAIADEIVDRAGSGRIWLVWRDGYRTFGDQCETLLAALAARVGASRPLVEPRPGVFEPMALHTFDPVVGAGSD